MSCHGCGADVTPQDRFCESCGLRQPDPADRVERDADGVAGVSDRGLRHHRNEDALALGVHESVSYAVVCDGVSISDRPDEASRAAADTAAELLAAAVESAGDFAVASKEAATAAGAAVNALADSGSGDGAPACTFLSAVVTAESVIVAWLGDSRAYWLTADPATGTSETLTVDHSWAADMVAAGRLTAEQAAADPRAHALTGWLGADAAPDQSTPNVLTFRPSGPGVVLLCSDGLWNYRPDAAELAAMVMPDARHDPLTAAKSLVQYALLRGGQDNVTVAVLPFPPTPRGERR